MLTKQNLAMLTKLFNPFYQAQQIVARMLHLKPHQLTQLADEQQTELLAQLVTEPKKEGDLFGEHVRLLGLWSASLGYKPWMQQPCTMLTVQLEPAQDWAKYLSDSGRIFGADARHAWVLFELSRYEVNWAGSTRRSKYVLVPLIDCVHQHAESEVFTHQAA